jgi:hypothetical protein
MKVLYDSAMGNWIPANPSSGNKIIAALLRHVYGQALLSL